MRSEASEQVSEYAKRVREAMKRSQLGPSTGGAPGSRMGEVWWALCTKHRVDGVRTVLGSRDPTTGRTHAPSRERHGHARREPAQAVESRSCGGGGRRRRRSKPAGTISTGRDRRTGAKGSHVGRRRRWEIRGRRRRGRRRQRHEGHRQLHHCVCYYSVHCTYCLESELVAVTVAFIQTFSL